MTSIITGDIINSRKLAHPEAWLALLKKELSAYGKSPKTWEIYRGDSFQLEVSQPELSLLAAIRIKAGIRTVKGLDVRMAISIGKKSYDAPRITESNGKVFIHSGELFEQLSQRKQTLAVKSPWAQTDGELNLIISLASIVMDKWTPSSAELVSWSLQLGTADQKTLQKKLKITQSSISERQTRAHFREILEAESFFRKKIQQQMK